MSGECDECGHHAVECKCVKPQGIPIYEVDFSVRTSNILKYCGITHLEQLTQLSTRTILKWRNVGKKSFNEIRTKLAERGMSLSDETVNPDVKKMILEDIPNILHGIKKQIDEMKNELHFLGFKVEQVAIEAQKTKKKLD